MKSIINYNKNNLLKGCNVIFGAVYTIKNNYCNILTSLDPEKWKEKCCFYNVLLKGQPSEKWEQIIENCVIRKI